jgi:enoyl-CoA hydratase/carnithine racemase
VDYGEISYQVVDRVAIITLDRPEHLNAFTYRMHEELLDALDRVDRDDDVRAVVVTGRGQAFCAGADLSAGGSSFEAETSRGSDGTVYRDTGGRVALRLFGCTKPLIAAINGPAVGVGASIVLPMDVRVAGASARIGFVFARRGIVPESCSAWFLPRVVGINRALEWALSGRLFDASEALEAGLVRWVGPDAELLSKANAVAHEIADNTSAVSVALTRQMMWRMLGEPHPMAAHRVDSRALEYMAATPDAREGVESFLERRPPRFTMTVSGDLPEFYPWWDEPVF